MVDAGTVSIQKTTFGSSIATGGIGGRGGDITLLTEPGTAGSGGDGRAAGWRCSGPARPLCSIPRSALIRRRAARAAGGNNNATSSLNPPTVAGGSGGTGAGGAVWAGGNSVTITNTTFSNDTAARATAAPAAQRPI